MDMLNLEFNNEEFDGVRFQAVLHHLPIIDSEQGADMAIREAYRVLKPEGICYVFVKAETGTRRGFMAVDTGEGLGARFYQFYSKEFLRQLLERNGFHLLSDIEEWTDERGEVNLIAFAKKSIRVSEQSSNVTKNVAIAKGTHPNGASLNYASEALSIIADYLRSGNIVIFGDMHRGERKLQDDEVWDHELFLDYVEQLGELPMNFSVALELPHLQKLIKLLPITPIDTEELRQIYKHVKEVITAA